MHLELSDGSPNETTTGREKSYPNFVISIQLCEKGAQSSKSSAYRNPPATPFRALGGGGGKGGANLSDSLGYGANTLLLKSYCICPKYGANKIGWMNSGIVIGNTKISQELEINPTL